MLRRFAVVALAGTGLLGIALASSTAEARDRSQDHRGVPPVVGQAKPTENFAIPSGWRVKCVLPFCGHDFNPSRERERDHRSAPHKRPK
jgi:hypothetical protein